MFENNIIENSCIVFRRGQLGLGSLESEEVPILIEALAGIKVSQSKCK